MSKIQIMSFIMIIVAIAIFAFTPYINRSYNEYIGRRLVFAMYDFDPVRVVEQDRVIRNILTEDLAFFYAISNDMRMLNVYLRFEMRPATPIIIYQNNNLVIFTIDGEAMEPDRIFQIIFTRRGRRVDSIKEFELFPIPPTGIWNFR